MSSYSEKLKDPRWQKKRLIILERDDWACQVCKDKLKTLTVHHIYYFGYIDPWDYEDHMLVTLCESCHNKEHYSYKCEDEKFENRKNGIMNIEFNNIITEFLYNIEVFSNSQPSRYTVFLPKRIENLRKKVRDDFHDLFKKNTIEWVSNLSHEEKLSSYEATKKTIGEEFLTHQEYEDKIKKLSEKLGL